MSSLNGTNGFVINGESERDYAGSSASGAGDINGDGIDDIVIGAFRADPNGNFSGRSYVVFGTLANRPAAINLNDLDGINGFTVNGEAPGDYFGASVSSAGDFNGDGIDDIIIGAPRSDANDIDSGSSYIVFGRKRIFEDGFES